MNNLCSSSHINTNVYAWCVDMDDDKIESRQTPTRLPSGTSPKRAKTTVHGQFVHTGGDGDGSESQISRSTFTPIAFLSEPWRNPGTATQMITLTIQLPSGTKSFYSRIVDDGDFVELKVQWASAMVDVDVLHRKWLQPKQKSNLGSSSAIQRYHPKILAIESALKTFREHSTSTICSYARIQLPFCVQPEPTKHNLSFSDESTLIHQIDMTAFTDDYDVKEDTPNFEIV